MNSTIVALKVAGTLFAVVALVHAWRVVKAIEVTVGGQQLPMSISVIGAVVAGGLSMWMWKLASARR